tara:strand:- start:838 stop:1155 length:318 start_codon:yes stop_codon:yes gene_type:complete
MPKPRKLNIKIKTDKHQSVKRYYNNVKYPAPPISIDDVYIKATVNQRLDLLAKRFYNDVDLWWVINIANPNLIPRDSMFIPVGTQIRIPANVNAIIEQFEELNNQ